MAEFDFILGQEDQIALIQYFLDTGAEFIPYFAYESPEYIVINDPRELNAIAQKGILFGPVFIIWKNISNYHFVFYESKRKEGIRFFLGQKEGGPYMDTVLCEIIQRDGKTYITNGFISYYPEFWIEELDAMIPVPQEIKDHYKAATSFLRKLCTRARQGRRIYWIGKHALKQFHEGTAFTFLDNLEIPPPSQRKYK